MTDDGSFGYAVNPPLEPAAEEPMPEPEEFRHHPERHPSHEEIARLAYRYWEEDGRPEFDADKTYANWIEAVIHLEHHAGHDVTAE